jgi:hypothetical protein
MKPRDVKESEMRNRGYLCTLLAFAAALVIPAGVTTAAPAEVSHTQAVGALFNTCVGEPPGELVDFTGTARVLDKPNADGSFKTSLNIQGTGTGSLGNEYVLHFDLLLVRASSGLLTLDDEKTTLVSRGSAPNQDVRFHFSSDSPDIIFTVDCHG